MKPSRFTGEELPCAFCMEEGRIGLIRREHGPRYQGLLGRCDNPFCRKLVNWKEYEYQYTMYCRIKAGMEKEPEVPPEVPEAVVKPRTRSVAALAVFGEKDTQD